MTSSRSISPRRRHRTIGAAAIAAVSTILVVSACSGPGAGGSDGSSAGVTDQGLVPAGGVAGSAVEPYSSAPGRPAAGLPASARATRLTDINALALDRAQIKKAQIALRSDKVASVVSQIETIAVSQGGFIDSEDTATDTHGVAQSSSITLRVPVDAFTTTVDDVSRLGSLESKKTTTVDVTGQVADVASRVTSAKDSITQLRVLFSHATKLADIITLESELSSRESDLEALQAQQRVLTAQTSLSTVSVSVARVQTPITKTADDDQTGFLGGLRQGWDALVRTFDNLAHGLGAALPFAVTLGLLGLLVWAVARRLPRRRAGTSG